MSETESNPEGSQVIEWKHEGKIYSINWPQAGYDELVAQTKLLQSLNVKMTFFTVILIFVVIGQIISFFFR